MEENYSQGLKMRFLYYASKQAYKDIMAMRVYLPFYTEFVMQEHYWLIKNIPKNTIALDIGANVGDTALYFATSPNVSQVLSYEPFPRVFRQAKENLKRASINPITKKIKLYNAAVGATGGILSIPDLRVYDENLGEQNAINLKGGKRVRKVSFESIINKLKSPAILKIDIEGGENEIFASPCPMHHVVKAMVECHGTLEEARRIERVFIAQLFNVHFIKEGNLWFVYAWRNNISTKT